MKVVSDSFGNAFGIFGQTIIGEEVLQRQLRAEILLPSYNYSNCCPTSKIDPTGFGFWDADGWGGWTWNLTKNFVSESAQDVAAGSPVGLALAAGGNQWARKRLNQQLAQEEALLAGVASTLPIVDNYADALRKDAAQRARCSGLGSTAGFDAVYYWGVGTGILEQILAAKGVSNPNLSLYARNWLARFTIGNNLIGAAENFHKGNYVTAALHLLGARAVAGAAPSQYVSGLLQNESAWGRYFSSQHFIELDASLSASSAWIQRLKILGHEAFHLAIDNPVTSRLYQRGGLWTFLEETGANVFGGRFIKAITDPIHYVKDWPAFIQESAVAVGLTDAYLWWEQYSKQKEKQEMMLSEVSDSGNCGCR